MSEPRTPLVADAAINNADNDLKRIANFSRGILALDDVVMEFGGLNSAMAASRTRLETLEGEEAAAREQMAIERRDADQAMATARAEADNYVAGRRREAQEIDRRAQASADVIISEAKATAQARLDELDRQERERAKAINEQIDVLDGIEQAIVAARAEHDQLTAAVDALHAEHDRVFSVIEDAKARIGAK